jgi:hypothetical protein
VTVRVVFDVDYCAATEQVIDELLRRPMVHSLLFLEPFPKPSTFRLNMCAPGALIIKRGIHFLDETLFDPRAGAGIIFARYFKNKATVLPEKANALSGSREIGFFQLKPSKVGVVLIGIIVGNLAIKVEAGSRAVAPRSASSGPFAGPQAFGTRMSAKQDRCPGFGGDSLATA